jgi:nicotinamidase-related amidase
MLHIVLYVMIALFAIVLAMTLAGLALPRAHRAARTARLARSADDVWRAIRDIDAQPAWRRGLGRIERQDAGRWREHSRHGVIAFALDEDAPPRAGAPGRLVTRIADDRLPFGGRWIHVVAPDRDDPHATRVTITEDGFVTNPLFRFLSRFVFGHATTLEQYLVDLGRHLGVEVSPAPTDPIV